MQAYLELLFKEVIKLISNLVWLVTVAERKEWSSHLAQGCLHAGIITHCGLSKKSAEAVARRKWDALPTSEHFGEVFD